MVAGAARFSARQSRARLGPEDWIRAAREELIAGGVAAVKVERLAEALGVTIGSFYWHFKDRDALLAALLEDWKSANSEAMARAAQLPGASAAQRFDAFINLWVEEDGYSPLYDSAVRDWARSSVQVRSEIVTVDRFRIDLLKGIFLDFGYDEDRAEVRARIMYFHQVGFYALDLHDDESMRLRLRPLYVEALRDGPGKPA